MGRSPNCDKNELIKKGPWTPEEDQKLIDYIHKNGCGNWRTLPINAGLQRCGKSCRLRWTNYLRPDIKRGKFSFEEEETIIHLHSILGNKWSMIAARLPGRTDNEIKNYWNTHIRKRLLRMGIDPVTHSPRLDLLDLSSLFNTSSQMNLSRLLGLQLPYINPQILSTLAISTNQENHIDTFVPSNQIQDIPNLSPIGDNISCDQHYDRWHNIETLMSTNFQQDFVPTQNYDTFDDLNNIQLNDVINNFNFQSGPSTPTPITSSSNQINGSITEDEKESYCSNLKFNMIPENLMDDYPFMYLNCLDNTY